MLMDLDYIKVIIMDLPRKVRAFTISDGFDHFTIFLNAGLNIEMQKKAYDHELAHINNRDFDNILTADDVERLRHVG